MNPQALTLTNYRAFTSAVIPLDVVEAASITGPNGAGKSSVCEAILWALFGEGRSTGIDGVVALGQSEACVELEYAHNGQLYRVIRKRSRGKKSDLQYLIRDGEDWRPLSGATIAETQAKITHDLAMDKTLFLASSFVMQGDSAGICEAGPAERKAVLTQILEDRLGKFGPLHDLAKLQVKRIDESLAASRAKRSDLEARIAERDGVLVSQAQAENVLAVLRDKLSDAEAALKALQTKAAAAQAQRDRVTELTRSVVNVNAEITDLEDAVRKQKLAVQEAEVLLKRAEEVRKQVDEAATVENQLRLAEQTKSKYQDLGKQFTELKAELDRVKAIIQRGLDHVESRRGEVNRALEECDRRYSLIQEVPCHDSPMASECKLLANARAAGEEILAYRTELQALDEEEKSVRVDMDAHEARYGGELEPLRAKAKALNYDAEAHNNLEHRLSSLQPARDLLPAISGAEAKRDAANAAIGDALKALTAKRMQLTGAESELEKAQAELPAAADVTQMDDLNREVSELRGSIERETRAAAVAEEQLRQIDAAQADLDVLNESMAEAEGKRLVTATLQEAFSRDGIPALIIDAAIPEIEEIANEVLSRLSDGRMVIKLVTQRATQSAGIRETLDIIVSDPSGERPYEDYSGGEKLRIDLAVRIALGRLLAQRNGAKIELLILDEVCAPLDEAGEEALIDCINRLRSTFACILLITHRDSLRDRLPQQIVVSKNGGGSQVALTV